MRTLLKLQLGYRDDPDAVYERAVGAGAYIVRELQDSPHVTRGFIARDPESLHWNFGTPLPEGPSDGKPA